MGEQLATSGESSLYQLMSTYWKENLNRKLYCMDCTTTMTQCMSLHAPGQGFPSSIEGGETFTPSGGEWEVLVGEFNLWWWEPEEEQAFMQRNLHTNDVTRAWKFVHSIDWEHNWELLIACPQWLRCWIPSPGVPCSKPLSGSKIDSTFHPFEVDKMSTGNFWELSGKK